MVANGGKRRSLAQSMRDAGYSESYARNPQKIKKTRAWREGIDEYLPDDLIASAHRKLMDAQRFRKMTFPSVMQDEEIAYVLAMNGNKALSICRNRYFAHALVLEADRTAMRYALDLAYKAKGLYRNTPPAHEMWPFRELTDSQLREAIKEAQLVLRKA